MGKAKLIANPTRGTISHFFIVSSRRLDIACRRTTCFGSLTVVAKGLRATMQIARDLSFRVKLKRDVLHPVGNANQKGFLFPTPDLFQRHHALLHNGGVKTLFEGAGRPSCVSARESPPIGAKPVTLSGDDGPCRTERWISAEGRWTGSYFCN